MEKFEAIRTLANNLATAARRSVKQMTRKTVSAALWPVPYYSRWGMYPQALFLITALVWLEYRPNWAIQGPGVAMGFLAVAAFFMAVRGPESTRIEGAIWIAISVCLFGAEMHAISVERKQHDIEQTQLRTKEDALRRQQAEAFTQLIGQGQNLFRSLAEEKFLTAQNLEHITGGNEYCWVVPMDPLPVVLGGSPVYQGDNWWQLALKNSGKVVLPTCDLRFQPFPTDEETKRGVPPPVMLFYHFEKVPVMGRRYSRTTPNFIKGDRVYSGVIETPTRTFFEVIKFEPDPHNLGRYIPNCQVETPSGKTLEKDCNPQ